MLEVETDLKMQQKLSALTMQPEWDYFLAYLSQIRESENTKFDVEGITLDRVNFLQGSLKRLRKIAELREDLANMRTAASVEAAGKGE